MALFYSKKYFEMARWRGKTSYSLKKLDAVLAEWQQFGEVIKLNSYKFALRFLSPLDVKNSELSLAIGAAAYAIITQNNFNHKWHDTITETFEEGYEAGFLVTDILHAFYAR